MVRAPLVWDDLALLLKRPVQIKQHRCRLRCRTEKKVTADGPDEKELKKREKQRLEKEKKELKERQEREKKEQKEKEKRENEMKKKFKVSDVILTGEGRCGRRQRGRGQCMCWHSNLSGFIPP